MFHRVKSEVQPEQVAVQKEKIDIKTEAPIQTPVQTLSQPADVPDFKTSNETVETPVIVKTPVNKETEQPANSKKETKSMSKSTEQKTIPANEPITEAYQAPAPSAGGYPGAYPGYSATGTTDASASAGDRRLTIGAGITMSGEIESCDYLLVEGTVEAALKGASVLDIAESGVFYGTVEIADATIAGRFEGDITAHGRLTLREGASVTGTIAYKELEIEAGAVIDGKLTPLSAAPAAVAPKPAERPAVKAPAAKAQATAEVKQEPANTDGGLFTKTAVSAE